MTRLVIADDHQLFREGLRQLLTRSGEFEVVGEAGSAAETMHCVRMQVFDVLILDLAMPGRSGVDLVRQVKTERPALPVLVLSMHAEDQYAVRALAAGASAYLTKGSRAEVLQQALRRLASGGRFIGDSVAELLAQEVQPHTDKPAYRSLSDREFQVMHALVNGESVSAIAQQLHLSVKTVSTHKTHVLSKLGCANLAELVRYAIDQNITTQTPSPERAPGATGPDSS
ncbi:MAG: response regulator [Roseateles sp.]|uniref:response regulator n=1 Tax=Roseateles sp. TaxID=1971397 RepID=UPI004036A813